MTVQLEAQMLASLWQQLRYITTYLAIYNLVLDIAKYKTILKEHNTARRKTHNITQAQALKQYQA